MHVRCRRTRPAHHLIAHWQSRSAAPGSRWRPALGRVAFASLRVRLLLLVLLAVVPALALILYTGLEQRRLAARDVQAQALRVAGLAASRQQRLIEDTRQVLATVAQLPAIQERHPPTLAAVLARLRAGDPRYANLGAILPNGDLFVSALPVEGQPTFGDRTYFRRAMETRAFAVGDYQIGRITGKATLNFGYPVLDEAGEVQLVIFAALDLAWLNQFAADAQLPAGATLLVSDRNGTVLAHYPDEERWVGQAVPETPIIRTMLQSRGEGTAEVAGLDGIPRLFAFTPLRAGGGPDVYVSIGMPRVVAFAEAHRALARNVAGLGLVALLALAAAWVVGDRFIVRPVQVLVHTTQRLAAGDMLVRTGLGGGSGELSQLARAFDQMVEALQQREAQLHYAERLYRTLVEQTPTVSYVSTLDECRRVRYISRQIEALLGFTAEEWQRVPDRWCRQLHADDRERVLAASAQTRTTGAPFQAEYRLLAQDGRVVWVLDQAVVVEEVGQRFMLQGVMLDSTARKQAEEANEAKAAVLLRLDGALQTHMQGLMDWAQALEQTRLSREQRGRVEQIVAEGQQLLALLEARPETTAGGRGQTVVHPTPREQGGSTPHGPLI